MNDETGSTNENPADGSSATESKSRSRYSVAEFPGEGVLHLVYTKANGDVSFATQELPDAVRQDLAAFGLNVYLSRKRDGADGYEAVKARDTSVWSELTSGTFEPGEGLAEGGQRINDLADAVFTVMKRSNPSADREVIYAKLRDIYRVTLTKKDSTEDQKTAAKKARKLLQGYEAKEDVAAELVKIRGARATDVDLGDLLS